MYWDKSRYRVRRRSTAIAVAVATTALVIFVPPPALASSSLTMTAPYDNAYANNGCGVVLGAVIGRVCQPSPTTAADRATGELDAGVYLVGGVCCLNTDIPAAHNIAMISTSHYLAEPTPSITYDVAIDVESATSHWGVVWVSAEASTSPCLDREGCGGGASQMLASDATLGNPQAGINPGEDLILGFEFTNPDGGDIPPGEVRVGVRLEAGAWGLLHPRQAEAHVTVTSITATSEGTINAQPDFQLHATGYKDRGLQTVDLTWTGASGSYVDIYRDATLVATSWNSGSHTDSLGQRGPGTYVYQLCEAGTSTCSNEATVEF